jgi:hypothetical protein
MLAREKGVRELAARRDKDEKLAASYRRKGEKAY